MDPNDQVDLNGTNEGYHIKLEAPLLREGLSIEVGPVSEKYVVPTVLKAMSMARAINKQDGSKSND